MTSSAKTFYSMSSDDLTGLREIENQVNRWAVADGCRIVSVSIAARTGNGGFTCGWVAMVAFQK